MSEVEDDERRSPPLGTLSMNVKRREHVAVMNNRKNCEIIKTH